MSCRCGAGADRYLVAPKKDFCIRLSDLKRVSTSDAVSTTHYPSSDAVKDWTFDRESSC